MFYLYIIQSKHHGSYYTGTAGSVEKRLKQHNNGAVKSTKSKSPWILVHTEKFDTLSAARQREVYLKSLKKRKEIEEIVKHF